MDFSRTEIITGKEGIKKLKNSTAAVFGLGGVGGYVFEALLRAGIGKIYIFDFDKFHPSNLNRQILSLEDNIGKSKTETAFFRGRMINSTAEIIARDIHLTYENIQSILPEDIEYAVDAIDEVSPKISLISELHKKNITFISSMGAGNRTDPSKILIDDISKTSYCPLARRVRKELKKKSIYKDVPVVYSTEQPVKRINFNQQESTIGSISYLPGIFGLFAAGYIIKKIIE